jgi:hypothetical protein
MWKNAALATFINIFGLSLLVLSQIKFLIPYKRLLIHQQWVNLAVFMAMLSLNLFCAYVFLASKFLMKQTGSRLRHAQKQLRDGEIMNELSDRLSAEE